MGKFVGWKCDSCNTTENGNDAPVDWLRLRLPGNGGDNTRDFCTDKCLFVFAKARHGGGSVTGKQKAPRELLDFMSARGINSSQKGAVFGTHVRRRHEIAGTVGDCVVCEWLTTKEAE